MKSFIYIFPFLFLFINCSNDENTQKEDRLKLEKLATEINNLADSSVCNENSECAYIAFGKKPCGGPWGYIVYSISINTEILLNKVEEYNQLEDEYNVKWGVISDCMFVTPPISLICENGKCIAVY